MGLPAGYTVGRFRGRKNGTSVELSADRRRLKLYAQALGGNDVVSFNLYRLGEDGWRLKPCEMPVPKVVDFVLGFEPGPPRHRCDRRR